MSNYTQESILELTTKLGVGGKSVIEHVFFTPPLKIINPIYEEDVANIMLLSVSAGLMKDDKQRIDIKIGAGSQIKLTSQSYEKIHNTLDGKASRKSKIILEDEAYLNYTPLPTIPFKNSDFENATSIFLQENSTLHYGEIFCAGRVSRGEIFEFKNFISRCHIYCNEKLLFFDNMSLNPRETKLTSVCMFNKFTHYLNLIIWDKNQDIDLLYEKLKDTKINAGITKNANGVIVIRALDYESERLLDLKSYLGF
ncbi:MULTISPECIES: urease accessory protein UreD [unclassified Helicobacter]|uniref:urease accessory protein UreD n=1 Tax=unclassified Helicobacter TaxID=2593540 RepID=UPI000CF0BE5C|nr:MULTISPECIES: urease accessory protein UreD [unclassified Helicobacter]